MNKKNHDKHKDTSVEVSVLFYIHDLSSFDKYIFHVLQHFTLKLFQGVPWSDLHSSLAWSWADANMSAFAIDQAWVQHPF